MGYILFRADNVTQAGQYFMGLFHFGANSFAACFALLEVQAFDFAFLFVMAAIILFTDLFIQQHPDYLGWLDGKNPIIQALFYTGGIVLLVVFGMYGKGYVENPFIYFQF